MSYDEKLADRIAHCLKGKHGISQKRMFGGLCFLAHGNMLCGVVKDKLMARVGPDAYEHCLSLKHVEPMDFTGKPMKGMVYVLPPGTKTQAALQKWVDRSMDFVKTLPKK